MAVQWQGMMEFIFWAGQKAPAICAVHSGTPDTLYLHADYGLGPITYTSRRSVKMQCCTAVRCTHLRWKLGSTRLLGVAGSLTRCWVVYLRY